MSYICLYPDHLLLSDAQIEENGDISGWVVNGCWHYKEVDGVVYCFGYEGFRNLSEARVARPVPADRKVVIVSEMGDYNEVLDRYRDAPDDRPNLQEALDRAYIEELNMRNREQLDDDNIPF